MTLNSGRRRTVLNIEAEATQLKSASTKSITWNAPMLPAPQPPLPSLALLPEAAVVLAPGGLVLAVEPAGRRVVPHRARGLHPARPRARSRAAVGGGRRPRDRIARPGRPARGRARRRRPVRDGRERARARGRRPVVRLPRARPAPDNLAGRRLRSHADRHGPVQHRRRVRARQRRAVRDARPRRGRAARRAATQELTHPDDRQGDVDAAWRILRGDTHSRQAEKRFVRPDGDVVWALANLTFLRDEHGRPLCWVGQFQDITELRRLASRDPLTDALNRRAFELELGPLRPTAAAAAARPRRLQGRQRHPRPRRRRRAAPRDRRRHRAAGCGATTCSPASAATSSPCCCPGARWTRPPAWPSTSPC